MVLAFGLGLLVSLGADARPVGGVVALVGLLLLVPPLVAYRTTEFGVTNKRVIIKVGLVRSHSAEILLSKIEAITVDQDMWGNLLNFGTVGITGTGGTLERFEKIGNPFEFRRRTQEQVVAGQDTTVHWGPQMRPER